MNIIKEKLQNADEIVIWGFSREGKNNPPVDAASKRLYEYCKKNNIWDKVIFCVDSKEVEQGTNIFGKITYHPSALAEYRDALVIVNNINQILITNAAKEMGLLNELVFIPYYFQHNYVGGFYPAGTYDGEDYHTYMKHHIKTISNIYENNDSITCEKLEVMNKMTELGDDTMYSLDFYGNTGAYHTYFCEETLAATGDVTLVDVGAFTGDSIEPISKYYGSRMKKIYAFEPDTENRKKLESYLGRNGLDKITEVFDCALGAETGVICFDANEATSRCTEDGTDKVLVNKFDNIYSGHLGTLMIKMDIEGQELNALKGMENVIKQHQPYLAICVYHKLGDILEIPQYIKSLCPQYKFYLRGGWHLECWAIPNE